MAQVVRIATRRSRLAIWQANRVKELIETASNGDLDCELVTMSTTGDQLLDKALHSEGGKGLFLKELEMALLANEADLAVHSMKDVPVEVDDRFRLHSIGERGSVNDVFVGSQSVLKLPPDAKIGTSSLRRRALLNHVYRKSHVFDIRGNVESRLKKLDEGLVDGLILAAAGLERLGLEDRVTDTLSLNEFVPAAGQGVLAAEYLKTNDSLRGILGNLIDDEVENAVSAERLVAARVGADCASAFGSYCDFEAGRYRLRAFIASQSGEEIYRIQVERTEADVAATEVADLLLKQGAARLLDKP